MCVFVMCVGIGVRPRLRRPARSVDPGGRAGDQHGGPVVRQAQDVQRLGTQRRAVQPGDLLTQRHAHHA